MLDNLNNEKPMEKIVYKDPNQKEVGAVIELPTSSHLKDKVGNFEGRNVQPVDKGEADQTTKKLDELAKKGKGAINF